jgi:hypothetical protein
VIAIRDEITRVNHMVLALRDARRQLDATASSVPALAEKVTELDHHLLVLEDELIQYRAVFRMQLHAMPVMLDDKLYTLAGHVLRGEARPTKAQTALFAERRATAQSVRDRLGALVEEELAAFNAEAEAAGANPVAMPPLP